MFILGISAYYHDSAACLLIDGKIVSAAQEERFTRIKHDENFPVNAITFILKENKIKLTEVDEVVFYEKPFIKFERLLETYLSETPFGLEKQHLRQDLRPQQTYNCQIHLFDREKAPAAGS